MLPARRLTTRAATLAVSLSILLAAPGFATEDVTTPTPAPVPTAPAVAATTVSIDLPRSSAPLGTKVVLTGRATGGARKVTLETRDARGRWRPLASRTSSSTGAFRFRTPTWNRTHPLRVSTAATATSAAATSRTVKLRRTVLATTGGKKSSWRPILSRVVRWNPCQSHTVRINTKHAPKWFASEVKSALRNITLYTGIDFDYAGKTRRTSPTDATPVVVRWASKRTDSRLSGPTAGLGGTWSREGQIFRGVVILDRGEKLNRTAWRAILRHELAHVVGLDHVNDTKQRMHPRTVIGGDIKLRSRTWGRGDVAGLKRVGASYGCL